jgi:GAF domain-containing protein
MKDDFAAQAAALGDDDAIRAILEEVCALTHMGFAAVARVTEDRWIACQVLDKIEFGLNPGDELVVKTTICDDIRQSGRTIIIDHVGANFEWRTHPTPMLYGFESYASLPLTLDDGRFFGTLCAIDPEPRSLSEQETIAALADCAKRVVAILSARQPANR